jgi:hypothetical protein
MTKKGDPNPVVMLNSFQHLVKIFSAFGRHTFHPRPQDGVFRSDLSKNMPKDNIMKIEELKIKYPSGFEHAVHMTKEEIEQHIRLMGALKMFELGKISSGKAAELAGMSRV